MNTRFLEAFVWVAQLNSFRKAAEQLNLTQAAISSRISSLEEEFGKRLFDRDVREVRLTAAGRLLLEHADRILQARREMETAMQADAGLAGRLRIGVMETVVHAWLVDFLRAIQQAHPALQIELTVDSTQRLHAHLRRGALDVSLQTEPIIGEGIRNREIGSMPIAWICRPGEAGASQRTLADVLARPIITMTRGSQPHLALMEACESKNIRLPTLHYVASIDAIIKLVKAGVGNALVPRAAVHDHIESGALGLIACDAGLAPLRLVVSYAQDPASDAGRLIAALACAEAARYAERTGPAVASVVAEVAPDQA